MKIEANPKKIKKAILSIIAIKKTPEEIAGSKFILFRKSGIIAPKNPDRIIVTKIETANIKLKDKLFCHK